MAAGTGDLLDQEITDLAGQDGQVILGQAAQVPQGSRSVSGRVSHRRAWARRKANVRLPTPSGPTNRKACGNRREAVCPPCAERYRGDAYQLISAGLRGGKGVPEAVGEHLGRPVSLLAIDEGVQGGDDAPITLMSPRNFDGGKGLVES